MLEHDRLLSKGEKQGRQLQEEMTGKWNPLMSDGSVAYTPRRDDKYEKDIRRLEN